jgi:hypothetical protein
MFPPRPQPDRDAVHQPEGFAPTRLRLSRAARRHRGRRHTGSNARRRGAGKSAQKRARKQVRRDGR